jgi:hypothetical protein
MRRQLFGDDADRRVVESRLNLAATLRECGRCNESTTLLTQILNSLAMTVDDVTNDLAASTFLQMGTTMLALGVQPQAADECFDRAMMMHAVGDGGASERLASHRDDVGVALLEHRWVDEAMERFRQALALFDALAARGDENHSVRLRVARQRRVLRERLHLLVVSAGDCRAREDSRTAVRLSSNAVCAALITNGFSSSQARAREMRG